jgi:carbon monoxide dehydrogenase subunit G
MLHFEGEKDFPQALADVYAQLSDARFLVQCIPDATLVTAEADKAVCKIRPGFAFVRGTLEVTLTIVERVADSLVRMTMLSKGIGTSSDVEVAATLTAKDSGTHLQWRAEVTRLGGLLKAVPSGVIRGAAQKVIGEVWTNVEAKLGERH